ncbi:type II 3-dehydroquinate dehydratase [Pelistega europaea]|uniref:3-dehydroquinate dehydratase n=1 Tax=Pelistega europaea TaxID=106147 RepID=A0A7Y4LAD2_9BURK|nr:type II 3-dehydroquinate dehydratase [Pelistega europaea]NOL49954.1 type II 3-dehydroquinate dehydratase [Pelistega europaea]
MSLKVLVINGPNLNLLGKREPHIYGSTTLSQIEQQLIQKASSLGMTCECFQSNHEGDIVACIHAAMGSVDYIIINAGAYTHTSVAIRDALLGVAIPFIEVHLSNVYQREGFRHHSYLSDKAVAVICGLGAFGYEAALSFIATKK